MASSLQPCLVWWLVLLLIQAPHAQSQGRDLRPATPLLTAASENKLSLHRYREQTGCPPEAGAKWVKGVKVQSFSCEIGREQKAGLVDRAE